MPQAGGKSKFAAKSLDLTSRSPARVPSLCSNSMFSGASMALSDLIVFEFLVLGLPFTHGIVLDF